MLDRAVELIREAIGGARATLFLVDRGRGELVRRAGRLPELPALRVPIDRAGSRGTWRRRGRRRAWTTRRRTRDFGRTSIDAPGFSTASLLAHPVHDEGGAVIGVVELLNKDDGFSEQDEQTLAVLCGQLAQVLERTSLAGQLARARQRVAGVSLQRDPRQQRRNAVGAGARRQGGGDRCHRAAAG